jgi:hypothetical protein
MFDPSQGLRLPLADLLKSVPHLFGLGWRKHEVGIYNTPRFDENAVGLFPDCHESDLR